MEERVLIMKNRIIRNPAFIAVVVCGAVMVGSGCTTNTSGIHGDATISESPEGIVQIDPHIVVDNFQLAQGLKIEDIKSQFAGDLLKAQVTIVSKFNKDRRVQYKFLWFDAQGIEINPGSLPWTPLMLSGKESKAVQALAPNPSVREFKISIRPLK